MSTAAAGYARLHAMDLEYRLLNVFTVDDEPFTGNPLCVFPDGGQLDDAQMQAWARQFNLSETTFVTASRADEPGGDVRIFTASYEMPFAGHPTLGTAHVMADRLGVEAVTLSMPAGAIPVERTAAGWQLRANPATTRAVDSAPDDLASALGLPAGAVADDGARWVDAGVEQLVVEVQDAATVRACLPDVRGMYEHMGAEDRPPHAYAWAWTGESTVEARLFAVSGSVLEEDPATGSAAANLGSWLAWRGERGRTITVSQGAQVNRPSRLVVTIDDTGTVHVAGRVTEVGHGVVRVP